MAVGFGGCRATLDEVVAGRGALGDALFGADASRMHDTAEAADAANKPRIARRSGTIGHATVGARGPITLR